MKQSIGKNVTAQIEGTILTLTVDLKESLGLTKSQKNLLIASTNGNATLPDGSKVGLNIYRRVEPGGA